VGRRDELAGLDRAAVDKIRGMSWAHGEHGSRACSLSQRDRPAARPMSWRCRRFFDRRRSPSREQEYFIPRCHRDAVADGGMVPTFCGMAAASRAATTGRSSRRLRPMCRGDRAVPIWAMPMIGNLSKSPSRSNGPQHGRFRGALYPGGDRGGTEHGACREEVSNLTIARPALHSPQISGLRAFELAAQRLRCPVQLLELVAAVSESISGRWPPSSHP